MISSIIISNFDLYLVTSLYSNIYFNFFIYTIYKKENINMEEEHKSLLLPIAMKVAAKTIAFDLAFYSEEEMKEVKDDILTKNRDLKIESIVEGKEYVEEKLEDDPRYQELIKKGVKPLSAPSGQLFYLDFKYGDTD